MFNIHWVFIESHVTTWETIIIQYEKQDTNI